MTPANATEAPPMSITELMHREDVAIVAAWMAKQWVPDAVTAAMRRLKGRDDGK